MAMTVLALAPAGAALGQDKDNDRSEQRDTQSRNEHGRLDFIPLQIRGGRQDIRRILLIQAQIVEVARTDRLGVDFDNLDRLDVSDVPLFGSLFEKPLRAADLTDDNRVGAVYRAADDSIAALFNGRIDLSGVKLSVVNGKGRYDLVEPPRVLDVAPTDLGELGTLTSVQSVIAGSAQDGTTLVLGGLTATTTPQTASKIPALDDVPALRGLLLGTVHQRDDDELIIFIRPSIIAGDDS